MCDLFGKEYARLKNPRVLLWLNQLGTVELEAQVVEPNGKMVTREFSCSPLLATLLAAEDFGTRSNPLKLSWPKPKSSDYPILYFGPRSSKRIPQITLKRAKSNDKSSIVAIEKKLEKSEKDDWKNKKHPVKTFSPHGSEKLPGGEGKPLGITSPYRIDVGKKFKLPKEPGKTPGGGRLNDMLRPYGYSPSGEKKDADHVWEIQMGGKDTLGNLWPLDKKVNRASGRILSRSVFEVGNGENKRIPMSVLKARSRKGKPVWFEIVKTR